MNEEGTIYAVAVVLEANDPEEAFDRIADEVHPEPANAHFIGTPVEIRRAEEYDNLSVASQIVKRADAEPAYTVVGYYRDNNQPYTTTVYTHNGPEAALDLAHKTCAEDNDPTGEGEAPELEILALFAGELELVDFDRKETWA